MKLVLNLLFLCFFGLVQGQVDQEVWMQARMNGTLELDNGATTNFWGYSTYTPPSPGPKVFLPGPVLRFNQGDSVVVHFLNNSPEDHTIHFHGLDVIQGMDGVPNTSMAVEPDSIFDYGFRCTHAGNFMYHCHVLTSLHLAMGMYGMVIVDPDPSQSTIYENGPNYNQEYLFMCSEINRTWSDNPVSPGLFTLYEADYLMVNGKSGSQLHDGESDVNGTVHENIALRLANIGYGSVSFSFPEALNTIAHMSDGRVLPSPFACDSLTLFPGERYTLLVNSSVPLLDSIRLTYTDLRTGLPLGENILPVNIGDNGIGLAGQSALRILGNPIQKNIRIRNSTTKPTRITIWDSYGKKIQTNTVLPGTQEIAFPHSKGLYVLCTEEGEVIRFLK